MSDRAAQLAALRTRIRVAEGIADAGAHGVLPFRLAALDAALPGGGLPLGCVHDIAATDAAVGRRGGGDDGNGDDGNGHDGNGYEGGGRDGDGRDGDGRDGDNAGAATGFAAVLAARLAARAAVIGGPATVLWLTRENTLYPPGLMRFGLTPARLIVARAGSQKDLLWSLEETARSGAVAAAVGETAGLGLTESRRLQLAAEAGGVTLLLLPAGPVGQAGGSPPVAAVTRWRVQAAASRPAPGDPGVGQERWRLTLVRCRGGRPGAWTVDGRGSDGGLGMADPPPETAATARGRRAA